MAPPCRSRGLVRAASSAFTSLRSLRSPEMMPFESSTMTSLIPAASRMFAQATPAAPAPEMTTLSVVMSRLWTFTAPLSAARTTMGGSVLIVVHDRAVESFDNALLDLEATRRRDVLEVDRAEARTQSDECLDDLVGILGVEN